MKTALRVLPVVLAALLLDRASAQTCNAGQSPRGLVVSGFADGIMNVPKGEDTDFLFRSAGKPNIFFLLDTSSSMLRLPPNGPSYYPGTLPPLYDVTGATDNGGMKNYNENCPDPSVRGGCAIIGCGLDPVSQGYADQSTTVMGFLAGRTYSPPCGTAVNGVNGQPYQYYLPNGTPTDYAHQSSACAHWSSAGGTDHQQTGDDGYDPDWYCGSTGDVLSCGGQKVNLFDKDMVFHDTVVDNPRTSWWIPDGWSYNSVNPAQHGGRPATVTEFCNDLYADGIYQGTQLKRQICSDCLTGTSSKGFFFDGRLLRVNQEGRTDNPAMPVPSIWFTGDYLNMYPPKFIVARKVMKDTIMTLSKVRSGIAHFSATGADHTPNQWQELKPTCDHPDSSFDSMRKTYMDTIDSFVFGGGTPLARAMLDIGQYYHSASLPWWSSGATWSEAPGYSASWNGGDNANSYSVCYACQTSNLVVVTDGLPKATDGNSLPVGGVTAAQATSTTIYAGDRNTGLVSASGGGGIPTSLCPLCNGLSDDWKNNPVRVAWYLHNFDLRSNSETTRDCGGNGGKQVMTTFTVGFGTSLLGDANTMLSNTAAMGGGTFVSAVNADILREGLKNIVETITTRSTSFSVATVSTLQTTAGHSVVVPRFDPANSAHWRGHLFRYELYSEFVSGCIETANGTGAGDLDCDGKCQSVFLMDQDGDFISEDTDGVLRKNDPPTKPTCAQAPACQTNGMGCAATGNAAATSWWDAQTAMSSSSWSTRKVYTAVDRAGANGSTTPDGKIDLNDGEMIAFTPGNADLIAPYMPASIPGYPNICDTVASRIESAGDAATAAAVRAPSRTFCIAEIIRWMLGADVFNESGAVIGTTWPKAVDGQDTLPDRPNKLGDVFHSSPVVVDPPLPPDGVLCPNGLSNQCLTSLWQTPVLSATTDRTAYDRYAKSDTYKNRRKLVVVGANDGMFHAFDGGTWHGLDSQDGGKDEWTWEHTNHQIDTSLPPFNGYFDRGSGRELWAVVPPDMLAKLPGYVLAQSVPDHQLLVDGSPMVQDVWVDGSQNAMSTNGDQSAGTRDQVGSKNGKKEPWEFHTVAVVGERRGGTHYFALDLTDATRFSDEPGFQPPKFLWMYPQPSSSETLTFAETYDDFLPVGPPIGPVRLEVSASDFPDAPTMTLPGVSSPTPYEERWIAFLSGGFDPQYLRGRGVHMVDVWTGAEIWDFSYPDDSTAANPDPTDRTQAYLRLNLKAPIPATVGMEMWGQNERRRRSFENDGYFDTATFGDAGGQLWVLRFAAPGHFENGRINNWFGARIFEMQGCVNQPFFYITANVPLSNGIYRVLAGTGDRFNLLDTNGGTCGPDNIRACMQRGCAVSINATTNYAQAAGLGKVSRALSGGSTCSISTSSSTSTVSTCDASAESQIGITCGNGASALATTKDVPVTCTEDSAGIFSCNVPSTSSQGGPLSASGTISAKNWFFSLRVWDDAAASGSPHVARSIFWIPEDAAAYDAARYTMSATGTFTTGIATIDGTLDNPTTGLAGADDPGWALWYDHDVTVDVDGHTYPVNKLDERTSSPSAVYGGVYWYTTQPATGSATRTQGNSCSDVNICSAESRRITYHYGADIATGGSIMHDVSGAIIRAGKDVTLVPKMADQPTVFVNQKGQVQVGLTSVNPERGATNLSAGQMMDPAPMYGFTEVGQDLHACRHSVTAPPANTCSDAMW